MRKPLITLLLASSIPSSYHLIMRGFGGKQSIKTCIYPKLGLHPLDPLLKGGGLDPTSHKNNYKNLLYYAPVPIQWWGNP